MRPVLQASPTYLLTDQVFRENAEFGFIYLNNPKVGCSTIKGSLWHAIGASNLRKHAGAVHVLEGSPFNTRLRDPEAARRAFVFTFVRNPFQRLVSAFLDKIDGKPIGNLPDFAGRGGVKPDQPISFDTFVEMLAAMPPEAQNPHWRPQYLNTLHPLIKPNLMADLSQLNALFPKVLERLFAPQGVVPQIVQSRSHSTKARALWTSFYSDKATLRRVLDLYAADFDAFGYAPSVEAEPVSAKLPVTSDHQHDELALLAEYWAAGKMKQKVAVLDRIEASAHAPCLADWLIAQRLLRAEKMPRLLQKLLEQHKKDIAAGPPYLQRIARDMAALAGSEPLTPSGRGAS